MPLFSTDTLNRFAQEAENNFINQQDNPCITSRIVLPIVNGTNQYTLPDTVKSIRRVTYRGFKLDPLGHRNFREVFQNAPQIGTPYWYIFNNIGQNKIQLFPTPGENLPGGTSLYSDTDISISCVVDFYIEPDYVTYTIPAYFRKRLLKAYVLKACFAMEGQGQSIKNSKYFSQKFDLLAQKYGILLDNLHNKPRKLTLNNVTGNTFFPAQPILPIASFGIGVDDGF